MRVYVTAATIGEWMPCFLNIDTFYTEKSKRFKLFFHQSGVGMMATTFSLTRLIAEEKPDLIIQVGIAGCFNKDENLGKVVIVDKDCLGDIGVDENGKWSDVFDMKLEKSNYYPFEKRMLPNQHLSTLNLLELKPVKGLTVNEITTSNKRIHQLTKKYNPFIETMEGAALHFVCRNMNVPFLQMRALSNYVGERDKSKWLMKESFDNLNNTLSKYIERLYKMN